MTAVCQYCRKSFVKESTLASHVCERKRRFQQENEVGVQWGFRAYQTFYQTTQNAARVKTYEEFVDSSYYTAFVRFGRHAHSIHCFNFANFTIWLLKNNVKLDQWCRDSNYQEWLLAYLKKESVNDALERSLQSILDYVQEHEQYRNGVADYFRLVNENRICYHISSGRVSAWAVFNCNTGTDFLTRLNEEQLSNIMLYIDPDYWQAKFRDCADDVKFAKKVLTLAGL